MALAAISAVIKGFGFLADVAEEVLRQRCLSFGLNIDNADDVEKNLPHTVELQHAEDVFNSVFMHTWPIIADHVKDWVLVSKDKVDHLLLIGVGTFIYVYLDEHIMGKWEGLAMTPGVFEDLPGGSLWDTTYGPWTRWYENRDNVWQLCDELLDLSGSDKLNLTYNRNKASHEILQLFA